MKCLVSPLDIYRILRGFQWEKSLGDVIVIFIEFVWFSSCLWLYKENYSTVQAAGGKGFCVGAQMLSEIPCSGNN